MAKIIKVTESVKDAVLQDVIDKLARVRMGIDGIKYENTFSYPEKRTAQVVYTQRAWFKTRMIVDYQGGEVGWHGLCYRDKDDPTVFKVTDIIVYPQKVTGTTINPDAMEYTKWMDGLDDDVFNHLRMHGHSHVNMEVFSSSTDEGFRNDRLTQLKDDDFYVFQVFNKRGDIHSAIYDYRDNILYENGDVETLVECDCEMSAWDSYVKVARMLKDVGTDALSEALVLYSSSNIEKFLDDSDKMIAPDTTPTYRAGNKKSKKSAVNDYARYPVYYEYYNGLDENYYDY